VAPLNSIHRLIGPFIHGFPFHLFLFLCVDWTRLFGTSARGPYSNKGEDTTKVARGEGGETFDGNDRQANADVTEYAIAYLFFWNPLGFRKHVKVASWPMTRKRVGIFYHF